MRPGGGQTQRGSFFTCAPASGYDFRMDVDGVDLSPALRRLYGVEPKATLHKLKGDASSRSYYRLTLDESARVPGKPERLVVMRLPEDALKSDEGGGQERIVELPFIDVQRLLARRGIPVPAVYLDDTRGRVLLLEDLGDETFAARLERTDRGQWPRLYAEAIELLARMHRACAEGTAADSIAFARRFDRALLRWELDHFREWGLEALTGPLEPRERAVVDRSFEALCDAITALPEGFVHRDYQSRNLMWAEGNRLTVIDFQDALRGPAVYDLCALLCDSYVALEQDEQTALIERYASFAGLHAAAARALHGAFWQVAAQRKLKDAGRFVFIDRVRKNPDFLRFFPQSLRYAGRALRILGHDELSDLLAQKLPGFPDRVAVPAATS